MSKDILKDNLSEFLSAYTKTFENIKAKEGVVPQLSKMATTLETMSVIINEIPTLESHPAEIRKNMGDIQQVANSLDALFEKSLTQIGYQADFTQHIKSIATIKNIFGWEVDTTQSSSSEKNPPPSVFGWEDELPKQ